MHSTWNVAMLVSRTLLKAIRTTVIPVQPGMETEGVTDLDKAVERFSLALNAFDVRILWKS